MEIYVVRHGRTRMNLEGTVIGHQDPPLLTESVGDVRALAEQLGGIPFRSIYTSDLHRAQHTADILQNALGSAIPLIVAEELREECFGRFEGEDKYQVRLKHPTFRSDPDFKPPGGESFRQLYERVASFIQAVPEEHSPALLVAHSGVIRALKAYFYELPLEQVIGRQMEHDIIMRCREVDGERSCELISGYVKR